MCRVRSDGATVPRGSLAVLMLAIAPAALSAQVGAAPLPEPPDLLPFFEAASHGWLERATQLARVLFSALFVLELVLSFYAWSAADLGLEDLLRELGIKAAVVGFVMIALLDPDFFIMPVIAAVREVGATAAGGPPMSPAEVMRSGVQLGNGLYLAAVPPLTTPSFVSATGVDPMTRVGNILSDTYLQVQFMSSNLASTLFLGAAVLVIEVSFLIVAAQLLLLDVEAFVVLTAGAFFLGFASFRLTAGLSEGYLRYATAVAIRIFLVYMMVGIMAQLLPPWQEALAASVSLAHIGEAGPLNPPQLNLGMLSLVVGSMGLFAYLAWKIPGSFARQLAGSLRPGLVRALRGGQ